MPSSITGKKLSPNGAHEVLFEQMSGAAAGYGGGFWAASPRQIISLRYVNDTLELKFQAVDVDKSLIMTYSPDYLTLSPGDSIKIQLMITAVTSLRPAGFDVLKFARQENLLKHFNITEGTL